MDSKDIANLLGGLNLSGMEQVTTEKTNRSYTAVAKKGETKLLMNVDWSLKKINSPQSQSVKDIIDVLCLTLRFMEKSQYGEHVFTVLPERKEDAQVNDGYYRYFPVQLPVAAYPAPPEYVRDKWDKQEVGTKTRDWLKAKIVKAGGELLVSDDALDSLLRAPLESKPSPEILPFKLPE